GVELDDVHRTSGFDREARLTRAVRLAVDRRLAVQRLGEDPRRGRLARPARAAEEVGVGDRALADGVAQRPHDVLLAPHLLEAPRSVPPVERLERHGPTLRETSRRRNATATVAELRRDDG